MGCGRPGTSKGSDLWTSSGVGGGQILRQQHVSGNLKGCKKARLVRPGSPRVEEWRQWSQGFMPSLHQRCTKLECAPLKQAIRPQVKLL